MGGYLRSNSISAVAPKAAQSSVLSLFMCCSIKSSVSMLKVRTVPCNIAWSGITLIASPA
ncbi:hypothetical protein MCHI_000994 [Candidatus Magnetoovum chiemensis]|nr:hypothetical protein MCHI_000994 [Candidatus Magnetoovum chiemensis]